MFGEEFAMVVDSVFDVGEFVHKSSDTMELNYGLSLAQKKSEFELCHRKDTHKLGEKNSQEFKKELQEGTQVVEGVCEGQSPTLCSLGTDSTVRLGWRIGAV